MTHRPFRTRSIFAAPLVLLIAACGGAGADGAAHTDAAPSTPATAVSGPASSPPDVGASGSSASPEPAGEAAPVAAPVKSGDLAARLRADPPDLTADRLPEGTKIGRCLLKVDGRTLISGRCSYRMEQDGAVHVDGPHQVFPGIDFPDPESMAGMISTDYWANAYPEGDGTWTAYGNASDVRAVHGDRDWGPLQQKGACFVNDRVRLCVWHS